MSKYLTKVDAFIAGFALSNIMWAVLTLMGWKI